MNNDLDLTEAAKLEPDEFKSVISNKFVALANFGFARQDFCLNHMNFQNCIKEVIKLRCTNK